TIRFGEHTKDRLRLLFITAAAIVLGFIPSWILYQQYGDKTNGRLNGGGLVGYVYGMAKGGTGYWSSVDYLKAHGLDGLSERAKDDILFDQTVTAIRSQPTMLLRGIAREYV